MLGVVLFASLTGNAFATDYVLTFVYRGTTYYLSRSHTSGVNVANSFNPDNCIWHCENSTGQEASLGTGGTWLYQEVRGIRYYLKHGGFIGVETGKDCRQPGGRSPNPQTWCLEGGCLFNGGPAGSSGPKHPKHFLCFQNYTVGNSSTPQAGCARPVVVTKTKVAACQVSSTTTLTEPTINLSSARLNYGESRTFTAVALAITTTVTRKAYTQYTLHLNPQRNYYQYNNWYYTSLNSIPTQTTVTYPPIAYRWALTGDANRFLTVAVDGATASVTYDVRNDSQADATSVLTVGITVGDQSGTSTSNAVITARQAAE